MIITKNNNNNKNTPITSKILNHSCWCGLRTYTFITIYLQRDCIEIIWYVPKLSTLKLHISSAAGQASDRTPVNYSPRSCCKTTLAPSITDQQMVIHLLHENRESICYLVVSIKTEGERDTCKLTRNIG